MYSKEEFTFKLSKPLNYQDTQSDQDTNELVLKAPIGKHEKYVCKLQQQLMQAMFKVRKLVGTENEAQSKDKDSLDEDDQVKKDMVLMALQAGCDGENGFYEFKCTFYKMICFEDGLCYIDGPNEKTKITLTLLKDLSLPDKDKLVGEYVANFISP